jgi:hypothetical protein
MFIGLFCKCLTLNCIYNKLLDNESGIGINSSIVWSYQCVSGAYSEHKSSLFLHGKYSNYNDFIIILMIYKDEPFHVNQTVEYCKNNFTSWDPKITTFPGL